MEDQAKKGEEPGDGQVIRQAEARSGEPAEAHEDADVQCG